MYVCIYNHNNMRVGDQLLTKRLLLNVLGVSAFNPTGTYVTELYVCSFTVVLCPGSSDCPLCIPRAPPLYVSCGSLNALI